ncbi:MAG: bifunctional 5,10-methylenetetrahydrofolate dehydrogenase/5,10-methenyltetrahydrofolate cyclohydrolase [Candidatus Saccharibacteria bacterium]|nr:bifunctional 5,10-methylenetetrahydrofolate dehydrogenase/5,10-methenyltetrahydrofolate cyclohydrolase [Candidatus Saccharibacteria bacterium]
MKILNGAELAGFIKERQAREAAGFKRKPCLLIIRDSDNPVILKYVRLKIRYGEDIGVKVLDYKASDTDDIARRIKEANADPEIDGMILQLPILDAERTDELTGLIAPEKDVDGLSQASNYNSATATAILWLLAGYDIDLKGRKVALVGRGKLVGAPLLKILTDSGVAVEMFHRGSDLTKLKDFDIIISATGKAGLILSDYVSSGVVIVDAGTASEGGVLKGDVADEVRERRDIAAITPVIGGVGPLTVTCLFEHVLLAYNKKK